MKSIRSLKPKGSTFQLDLNSLVEGGLGQSWEHLPSPNVAWVQFLDLTSRAGRVYWFSIHPCHTAAILSRETKKALVYHAKPRNGNHEDEA